MVNKLFVWCGDVSDGTAYLFINLFDIAFTLADIGVSYQKDNSKQMNLITIIWLVCSIASFLVFIFQKKTNTMIQYIYMVLRLFFVLFSFLMLSFSIAIFFGTGQQYSSDKNINQTILVQTILIWLFSLYDLYLSCLLRTIVNRKEQL